MTAHAAPRMTPALTALMAIGSGLSVASNYYAQPLLALFVQVFRISIGHAGVLVTCSQIGYICGLVFLVPLGDRLERRKLLTATAALTSAGLLAMGLAPDFSLLLVASVCVGFTSVTAQILVPLAAHLATPERRGRTVSVVMSGLLLGILLARTFAGVIADVSGWRTVFLSASALMAVFAVLCWRLLPSIAPTSTGSYGALLASAARLFGQQPVLRRRALIGGLNFASFAALWTTLAFLLKDRWGYGEAAIGLFGLIGAAGALCAQVAGRLSDAGYNRQATGGFILLGVLGWGFMYLGGHSQAALVVGILLLDLGVQGTHISNQSTIYALDPAARSRLTTCYMSSYFTGGAVGSALGAWAYAHGAWTGVCVVGGAACAIALLRWAVSEARPVSAG
ncbi:MFS transporter [Xylophilus sp. GOD-11R]|uniref:MFS transporter n=1 Tax=Xylophilus sp. GOD-11R TaxID=3089814 RepID=UPI00298D5874|nr:MFS transporter [Xylophilus sp. GOD-11R]WPB57089.1 MFS transporter [Xylophilus sp. GOD-11R]